MSVSVVIVGFRVVKTDSLGDVISMILRVSLLQNEMSGATRIRLQKPVIVPIAKRRPSRTKHRQQLTPHPQKTRESILYSIDSISIGVTTKFLGNFLFTNSLLADWCHIPQKTKLGARENEV